MVVCEILKLIMKVIYIINVKVGKNNPWIFDHTIKNRNVERYMRLAVDCMLMNYTATMKALFKFLGNHFQF